MNILVVGNGFDLAHDLRTGYPDFLDFMLKYSNDESMQICDENGDTLVEIDQEMRDLAKQENTILKHFFGVYKARCELGKKGWIDFEQELAIIVKTFDFMQNLKKGKIVLGPNDRLINFVSKDVMVNFFDAQFSTGIFTHKDYSVSEILEKGNELYKDLANVTRMLEIYLLVYANMQKITKRLLVIQNHSFDRILSFNYTDTFERLYGKGVEKYCYIHGRVRDNSDVNKCNLVLGIDEFLENSRINDDNTFLGFKKFYQRIFKENDSSYIDWIKETPVNTGNYTPLDIYYYGHSLDVTDKDILQRLIMHDKARNHFYYRNKISMSKQIANLIRIIGEENLIEKTRGKNRTIDFISMN